MKIKKANAVLGLVTAVLLLVHMSIMSYSLFTGWYNYAVCKMSARMVCTFFILHILVTLVVFFFCHEGSRITCKKQNFSVIMQRIEGLLMLLLIHSHVNAYSHMATGQTLTAGQSVRICVMEVLFFTAVTFHTTHSISNALITLGAVQTERAKGIVDKVCQTVGYALGLFAVIAVIRFFAGV